MGFVSNMLEVNEVLQSSHMGMVPGASDTGMLHLDLICVEGHRCQLVIGPQLEEPSTWSGLDVSSPVPTRFYMDLVLPD